MDGSIFTAAACVHLCPGCRRVTWQPLGDDCLLCQKGATTRA
jgi:hypothetical protein